MDRRGSSCPTLFVWDGEHYELVADMLGAGVIGHWVGAGRAQYSASHGVLKSMASASSEKDGKLSFRLMEPMEEVVYLDQVKLLAVDHPGNMRCLSQRIFRQQSAVSGFQGCGQPRCRASPAGAWDDHGHNLLPICSAPLLRRFRIAAFQRIHQTAQPGTRSRDALQRRPAVAA